MSVPQHLKEEIQFKARNRCCVCDEEDIQIHHIDGDHYNHDPDNLAPLCHRHHEKAQLALQVKKTMTIKFSPRFIKRCRDSHYEKYGLFAGVDVVTRDEHEALRQQVVSLQEQLIGDDEDE